jgi:hypothetical protein
LPDETHGKADEQRLNEWLITPELVFEQGSDDPSQDAHRDSSCGPHPEDLSERVLPDGCIPFVFALGCLLHHPRSIIMDTSNVDALADAPARDPHFNGRDPPHGRRPMTSGHNLGNREQDAVRVDPHV